LAEHLAVEIDDDRWRIDGVQRGVERQQRCVSLKSGLRPRNYTGALTYERPGQASAHEHIMNRPLQRVPRDPERSNQRGRRLLPRQW
jgi:hypothetical protein